ncbi:MAG: hypothetical protein U0P30_15170 [Vicinamibacterales bacterium]
MSAALLGGLLAFAAFACGAAVGTVVMHAVAVATRARSWGALGPRARAAVLRHARFSPLTLGLAFTGLVQLAFWVFEPPNQHEASGLVLSLLGAAGVALLGLVARRAWRGVHDTRALERAWRTSLAKPATVPGWTGVAWAIDTTFPVVAVTGVRRAELFVSRAVLATCTAEELAVIAAHERAHLAAHDNRSRLLFLLAPGAGAAAAELEQRWNDTAEEIADLQARAAGDGLTLAGALTKVARLAVAPAPTPCLASALIGGDTLEQRVRRLVAPAQPAGGSLRVVTAAALVPAAILAVWALPVVYAAAEWLVQVGR